MGRTHVLLAALALVLTPAVASAQDAPAAAPAAAVAAAEAPAAEAPVAEVPAGPTIEAPTPLQAVTDVGQPRAMGIGLQDQYTDVGVYGAWMHDAILLPLITIISLFVLALMIWVVVRYRAAANPDPSRTSHNTLIEVIWTVVPVLILVAISVPSIQLLARQYNPPKADLTVKVTGHQWYWTYEYPDDGELSFDSIMLSDEEAAKAGDPRLLGVDNRLVVPAGKVVKLLITASDVIHSWALPSFWVKMDAVPGRVNEAWFKVDRPGVYYGQCSELCGTKHGFMPIAVEVLPQADYDRWLAAKQTEAGIELTGAYAAPATPEAAEPAAPEGATANEGSNS